jgi:hypothetical protein
LEVLVFRELGFDLCRDVMDVNRLTVNNGSAARTSTNDGSLHFRNWQWPIVRDALKAISLNAKNHSIVCLTQPCGILRHHIQHRLQVRRRVGDHAEDLARGGLLTIARLKLLGEVLYYFFG